MANVANERDSDPSWQPQPAAAKFIQSVVETFLDQCLPAAHLAERMRTLTGTRFIDWIDHLVLPATVDIEDQLISVGFIEREADSHERCFVQENGVFPRVLLHDATNRSVRLRVAIRPESIVDFLMALDAAVFDQLANLPAGHDVIGECGGQMRQALIFQTAEAELWAVERHGHRGFLSPSPDLQRHQLARRHGEAFRLRRRRFDDEADGFAHTTALVEAAVRDIGRDWACDLFFAAERGFWQARNRAGQVQKQRQDQLGLGWGNHDHHTYRSSRKWFTHLVSLLEKLGVRCRERFYAGAEAGWGAQVMEQPNAGIVVFADVDLSPEEVRGDFAHEPLATRCEMSTPGLWCALHGEAILEAGMHHLECQFEFEALRDQLQANGIGVMKPFSNFPYLRQAFTEADRWPVRADRIERLLQAGTITPENATQFREHGALGSHLENLERNDGFKGFNQHGVSEILNTTDPRKN